MRIAVAIVTVSLLAVMSAVQMSSAAATKYKPCTLLAKGDIETALGAKLIPGSLAMLEDENEFEGQPVDFCDWKLAAGSVHHEVILWVGRAIAPLQQLASTWYDPKVELAKEGGAAVESVKVPGAECRILKNMKVPELKLVGHETSCLTISKGMALALDVTTTGKAPFTPQFVKKLLDRAASHLP